MAEVSQELLARIEADVRVQLAPKPKRLAHSLSVADTAVNLAERYGVSVSCAKAAGLLHDWYKVLSDAELVQLACERGIDMGVPLERVAPLLHGILAARDLPVRYPELPAEVFQAIERHTTAAADMQPLDCVIFVADGIEPRRPASPGIEHVRALVGTASLEDLFWESFVEGIIYVLEGERYLYPKTLDIYNTLALERADHKEQAS